MGLEHWTRHAVAAILLLVLIAAFFATQPSESNKNDIDSYTTSSTTTIKTPTSGTSNTHPVVLPPYNVPKKQDNLPSPPKSTVPEDSVPIVKYSAFHSFKDLHWWSDWSKPLPPGIRHGYYYPPFYEDEQTVKDLRSMCVSKTSDRPHLLYVHIYKTGGHNFDIWLDNFAQKCGLTFLDYHNIGYRSLEETLTPDLKNLNMLSKIDILGGHFPYGLHAVYPRAIYSTILRRPEWAFVSSELYKARRDRSVVNTIQTFEDAVRLVKQNLVFKIRTKKAGLAYRHDFHWRLTGRETTPESLEPDTDLVIEHLKQFTLIGYTEEWVLSIDQYQKLVDPFEVWDQWEAARNTVDNANGLFSTSEVLEALDPVHKMMLGDYCKYERKIFDASIEISIEKCKRLIPGTKCDVLRKYLDTRMPTSA